MLDALDGPALSAIVISRDDEDRIERALRSVVDQECDEPFEVILVTSGTDRTAAIARRLFPEVRVVELDHPALPGEARNAGLRFARGDIASFPGSHVELLPGSLAARMRAHDQGWTMVTGATHNGTATRAGWAAYFLDNSTVLPGRPSEKLTSAPAHCSYDRHALLAAGGFPDDVRAGEDTRVNEALFAAGGTAFRAADLPLVHHNRSRSVGHLVRHHLARGRAQVQFFRAQGPDGEARARRFFDGYAGRRLARIDANVAAWGDDLAGHYRRARPLVRLGIAAAWLGGRLELRRPTGPDVPGRDGDASGPPSTNGAPGRLPSRSTPLTRPVRVVRREPAPLRDHRVIFLHLPKTAGSTLAQVLEREYEDAPMRWIYGDARAEAHTLAAMPHDTRLALRLVAGHMATGLDRHLPGPSAYVTMLRDPVERIVSHYHYVLQRPEGTGNSRAVEGISSLDEYVRSSVFARIVNNGQTRLLGSDVMAPGEPADEATLERAMAFVDRPDVVAGLQERFDESLLVMVLAFGWGWPAVQRVNVTRSRPPVAELDPATVALIREHNALDLALHEHVRSRLEARLGAVDDLAAQLETFRLAARRLTPSPGTAAPPQSATNR